MAEIESLEIKLKANATSATKSIDALNTRLRTLSTTLSSVSGNRLTSLSQGVNNLANAMQVMKNVGTADFTRLTKNLQKLGSINANSMNAASGSIRRLSNAMQSLTTVNFTDTATQLSTLAGSINRIGYKSTDKAISNLPLLAQGLRDMMTTLSTAPAVSQNLIDMTNALAALANASGKSFSSSNRVSKGFRGISFSANRASKSVKSLAYYFGKLYANFWFVWRIAGKLKEAINLSSALTETQNVVDVTFGKMSNKVQELADKSIDALGMSELTVKQIASRYQAMGTAMGISENAVKKANTYLESQKVKYDNLGDSMADVSINLTKLAGDMASFYNMDQKAVAEDLEAIFTGQTRPLRQYGLDLTEATLKEYAMRNGLDANIKAMSQAEKTMLRYQYVLDNTKAAQGDFIRTQDTWANQIRMLQENFKVLGSTIGRVLINVLKPFVKALNVIIQQVNKFAVMVSNALGKIFGWKYEDGGGVADDLEAGAEFADDIDNGLGDAAKEAKKLKQQLQGFDELNVLSTPDESDNGSSGSGSSGGNGSSGLGGNWVEAESMLKSYESEIENLYQLGAKISKTLEDTLTSIDWDKVYEKANNFGKGLADFLNGLITPGLFSALGTTIGNSIKTALIAIDTFATTFDWTNFGNSLAEGANSFFKSFQFADLTKTLADWMNGIVDTAFAFIKTFKWDDFGKNMAEGINTFFSTFKFDKLGETIHDGIVGVLKTVTTFFKETDFIQIGEKIGEFLKNLKWADLLANLADAITAGVESAFELIGGLLKEAPLETAMIAGFALFEFSGFGKNVGEQLVKSIGKKLAESSTWNSFTSFFTGKSAGALKFAEYALAGLAAAIVGFEVGKKLGEAIATALGDYDSADAYKNFSWSDFFNGLNKEDMKGALNELKKDMKDNWGNFGLLVSFALDYPKDWVEMQKQSIKSAWGTCKLVISFAVDAVKGLVQTRLEEAKAAWGTLKLAIGFTFEAIKTFITNKVAEIKNLWGNVLLPIGFSLLKFDVKDAWNKVKEAWFGKDGKTERTVEVTPTTKDKTASTSASNIWTTFKSKWGTKEAEVGAKSKSGSASSVWEKFKKSWGTTKTVEVGAKNKSGNASSVWSTFKTNWGDKKTVDVGAQNKKGNADNVYNGLTTEWGTKSLGVNANIDKVTVPPNTTVALKATLSGFVMDSKYKGKNGMPSNLPIQWVATGGMFKGGKWNPIQQYAAGGLPDFGQMFVAREAGPELVGTIGNHTAVMNNDQIVASVAKGVYDAVVSAMSSSGNNVNVTLEGDAQGIFRVVQKASNDYTRRTGNPAFI